MTLRGFADGMEWCDTIHAHYWKSELAKIIADERRAIGSVVTVGVNSHMQA